MSVQSNLSRASWYARHNQTAVSIGYLVDAVQELARLPPQPAAAADPLRTFAVEALACLRLVREWADPRNGEPMSLLPSGLLDQTARVIMRGTVLLGGSNDGAQTAGGLAAAASGEPRPASAAGGPAATAGGCSGLP